MQSRFRTIRRGITLLEVLISIGVLAVGLVGTLALIPAGGSYLRKAQTESRAAALIPNAFSTIEACGLFGENAISWREEYALIREAEPSLSGYPRYPRAIDDISVDGAVITNFYIRDDPPWITGESGDADSGGVTVTAEGPGGIEKTFVVSPEADGKWRLALPAYALSLSDPRLDAEERMTVTNTGQSPDTIDTYYDEWSFTADRGTINVLPPLAPARESDADAPTAYRHYRKRRHYGYTFGDALLDFTMPFSAGDHQQNDSFADAQGFAAPQGYDRVRRRISGSVWRNEYGFRRGAYQDWRNYSNFFRDGPVQPHGNPRYISTNQGSEWVDSNGTPKASDVADGTYEGAVDNFVFNALTGQEFEIDWADTNDLYINQSFSDGDSGEAIKVYDQNGRLSANPSSTTTNKAGYTARADGPIYITIELLPAIDVGPRLNNFFPGHPEYQGSPCNYDIDVTIFGAGRVAIIDPLMASHLNSISGGNSGHPLHSKVRLAAEFQQTTSEGVTVPFIIQRLNWRIVGDLADATDAVAVAEALCRPADVLEVSDTGDELSSPEQRYEVGELSSCHSAPVYYRYGGGWSYCQECALQCEVTEVPLRRECDDKMSWFLTVQPEGEGSIQSNWQAGNYFDVAIAVFQDRIMPVAGDTKLEGEHAFDSWWNENTGLISIPIARSSGIDQDDIRRMFAADNWLMIAPKRPSLNQKIDWVQIQTCEFAREADRTVAHVLPVAEPNTGTTFGSSILDEGGQPNLVTVVYQGVVAVSRRSIQITE